MKGVDGLPRGRQRPAGPSRELAPVPLTVRSRSAETLCCVAREGSSKIFQKPLSTKHQMQNLAHGVSIVSALAGQAHSDQEVCSGLGCSWCGPRCLPCIAVLSPYTPLRARDLAQESMCCLKGNILLNVYTLACAG